MDKRRLGELSYQCFAARARAASGVSELASAMRRSREAPWSIIVFASGLTAGAGALAVQIGLQTEIRAPMWSFIALAALAFVAERQSVRLNANTEVSVSSLPILFAAVVC